MGVKKLSGPRSISGEREQQKKRSNLRTDEVEWDSSQQSTEQS